MAHGALTPIIGLRLLALAAGLRHNAEIGQPGLCFSAYGHKFGINHLVRRKLRPPGTERLEGAPEARLLGLLVERRVDVRADEPLHRRREALELAEGRFERGRERKLE